MHFPAVDCSSQRLVRKAESEYLFAKTCLQILNLFLFGKNKEKLL